MRKLLTVFIIILIILPTHALANSWPAAIAGSNFVWENITKLLIHLQKGKSEKRTKESKNEYVENLKKQKASTDPKPVDQTRKTSLLQRLDDFEGNRVKKD